MSTLLCSLLALAALLTLPEAQGCSASSVLIGRETSIFYNVPPIDVPRGGGRMFIPDYCHTQYGFELVGERVSACNKDPYGAPPDVRPTDNSDPHKPVDVVCSDGCAYGATAQVVQYCWPYQR